MEAQSPNRFLGLDAGRNGFRICRTAPISDEGDFANPVPVTFEGIPQLLPVYISGSSKNMTTKKSDWLRLVGQMKPGTELSLDYKIGFESNEVGPIQSIENHIQIIAKELKALFNVNSLASDAFILTVGLPVNWSDESIIIRQLLSIMRQNSFPNVLLCREPIAVVQYGIFSGILPLQEQEYTWLVIDSAGYETRFSVVGRSSNSSMLQLLDSIIFQWGGDKFDEALYDYVVSKYWMKSIPVEKNLKNGLLFLTRELKEKYSRSGCDRVEMDFYVDGIQDPIELDREIAESEALFAPIIRQFSHTLASESPLTGLLYKNIEGVILVGGNSHWKFLKDIVQDQWKGKLFWSPDDPELIVSKGLALANTGFAPTETISEKETIYQQSGHEVTPSPVTISEVPNASPIAPNVFVPQLLPERSKPQQRRPMAIGQGLPRTREAIHKQAWKIIIWCIVAGALFALVVSPIPCAAWPILLLLEAYMLYAIARLYGYKLSSGLLWLMLAGLLGISFVLSIVVGEVVSLISAFVAAPIVKPLVAGLVIWGLGAGAIFILDRQSVSQRK
jgi:uncharacterized protein (DUF697 family)